MYMYMYTYIYIYIYTHIHNYLYALSRAAAPTGRVGQRLPPTSLKSLKFFHP